jgi:transposase
MNNKHTAQQFGTYLGVDLGDRKHQVCVTDKEGTILDEFSITNTRESLRELAADHPKARVAIEVGTHSPWISRFLATEGMEVTVANARKLRAIYQNDRKCDELDARMLAKLLRADPDLLSPIHHGSEQAQKDLIAIKLRDSLVRQRAHMIATIRGLLKSVGLRLPACSTACFHDKAEQALLAHPEHQPSIQPALDCLAHLTAQIKHYEKLVRDACRDHHPEAVRLQQIPGVGPITAMAFVLTIEDPQRFKDPRDAGAYLGLVPRRDQSGGTDRQLPISKSGNSYLRKLLVQSAQYLLGHFGPDCALRRHGLKLAAKGGRAAKKKAVIAVARKLAVTMVALWQRGGCYEPFPHSPGQRDTKGGHATASTRATPECERQIATR